MGLLLVAVGRGTHLGRVRERFDASGTARRGPRGCECAPAEACWPRRCVALSTYRAPNSTFRRRGMSISDLFSDQWARGRRSGPAIGPEATAPQRGAPASRKGASGSHEDTGGLSGTLTTAPEGAPLGSRRRAAGAPGGARELPRRGGRD